MKTTWYCNDCESTIDREEIETHEAKGHEVRGMMRPDRLLGSDPWAISGRDEDAERSTGVRD